MRILITGGTGFIGAHLARRLAGETGVSIAILDNLRRGRKEALADIWSAIRFVEGDIRDRQAVRAAMQGADLVYHLAAQASVMTADANEDYTLATNVEGTRNVLQEALDAGVGRVVFTSSREVYGDPERLPVPESAPLAPKNAYGRSKVAGETLGREFHAAGGHIAVLRLANVYGPGDRDRVVPLFLDAALDGRPLTLFGGRQILDFVWIGTVVEALVRAGVRSFSDAPLIDEPLNIGSGKGTTIAELAERVVAATGSKSRIEIEPPRGIEVSRFVADVTRAGKFLGLVPPADPLFKLAEMVELARDVTV